jgi:ABC-type amino acid transport system permease subunit
MFIMDIINTNTNAVIYITGNNMINNMIEINTTDGHIFMDEDAIFDIRWRVRFEKKQGKTMNEILINIFDDDFIVGSRTEIEKIVNDAFLNE